MKDPVRVAVTIRSFNTQGPAYKKLREYCTITYMNTTGKRLSEPDLVQAVAETEGVIAGTERFSFEVISQARELRIISRVGVGTDSIDLISAKSQFVHIATTPNSPVQAVAEHTLALLLSSMKHIPQYNQQMREDNQTITSNSLLAGKTVGIAGIGRVGSRVAEMLEALGCQICFFDPLFSREPPLTWKRFNSLENMIGNVDILSLHSSPLPDGTPLITRDMLAVAGGLILVNTARGSLINEQALISALDSGCVSAAALDVFPTEPYTGGLLNFPQVIVTPHVASNTTESRAQMEMEAVDNLIHYFTEINP